MELLHAMRDLGVADPAADPVGEDTVRAALAREIEQATAAPRAHRRRRPRLRMRVAVPALAVAVGAAAAAVVVTGAVGDHAGGAPTPPAATPGVVHGQNTAYIIRRVRAKLATAGQGQVDVWVQAGGNGNPGSNSTSTTRSYTDPQTGVFYQSSILDSSDGTEIYAQYLVGTPVNGGTMRFETTALDPQQHLYAVSSDVGSPYGSTTGDAKQVRQELASGQATQEGTATVDGQTTIKLELPVQNGYSTILYVNAQTDAPVQSVSTSPAGATAPSATTNVNTEDWEPAQAANVSQTQLTQIPDGFRQVSVTALHQSNPAAR